MPMPMLMSMDDMIWYPWSGLLSTDMTMNNKKKEEEEEDKKMQTQQQTAWKG